MIRIGVIGTAEIAERKMIPAIIGNQNYEYVGVAIAQKEEWLEDNCEEYSIEKKVEKGQRFVSKFGGKLYEGYQTILEDPSIDAVYIPLPPSLHYRWAKVALEKGKHVFLEKPLTMNEKDTAELIELAKKKNLSVFENYAFIYHKQISMIKDIIESGDIGEVRLYQSSFGFPFRSKDDFRYKLNMGGGALLDAGGYLVRAATYFLGEGIRVATASLVKRQNSEVDLFGNITLIDDKKMCAQLSFGMDNYYRCSFVIWGQKGQIVAERFYTAPEDENVEIMVMNESKKKIMISDAQFGNSIQVFADSIKNRTYTSSYNSILQQARIMEEVYQKAKSGS